MANGCLSFSETVTHCEETVWSVEGGDDLPLCCFRPRRLNGEGMMGAVQEYGGSRGPVVVVVGGKFSVGGRKGSKKIINLSTSCISHVSVWPSLSAETSTASPRTVRTFNGDMVS